MAIEIKILVQTSVMFIWHYEKQEEEKEEEMATVPVTAVMYI